MKTIFEPVAGAATLARRMYTVVPLGEQASGALNDSGQVAFTERMPGGQTIAKFYDGTTIRNLGTLGGTSAVAAALNNAGQVAGYANFNATALTRAFRWSLASGMVELDPIRGGSESLASDINNVGEVVGTVLFPDQRPPHGVLWRPTGRPIDLGLNRSVSQILLINDMGHVMGNAIGADGRQFAFVWTTEDGAIALTGAGIVDSESRGINASGQVTGTFSSLDAGPTAFLWTPGQEFLPLFAQAAFPFAINDNAMVVGVLMDQVAFVWTRAGGMVNIGALPGGSFSNAYDVNNHNEVVGQAADAEGLRAFLWTEADGMIDLNDRLMQAPSGLVLSIATDINDNGSILAQTDNSALVLLVPFPQ